MIKVSNASILFLVTTLLSGCTFFKPEEKINPNKIIPLKLTKIDASVATGNPETYTVYGKEYEVLSTSKDYKAHGKVEIYPFSFDGSATSSGELFDSYKLTGANRTLPIPCYVKLTNAENGLSTNIRINDRGPFLTKAILNISPAVAYELGINKDNIEKTTITAIGIEPFTNITWPKEFYLQLAIFKNKEDAEKTISYLKKIFNFNNAQLINVNDNVTPMYGIEVGPFESKQIAKEYMNKNLQALPMIPAIIEK
ncbi:septal ring lytic transglycosylase RlpA family protein [Francisellaceae bacterium]|nr:septal ring lytic transglycosylase RlpA family protein [Francisellaceae bacterium]